MKKLVSFRNSLGSKAGRESLVKRLKSFLCYFGARPTQQRDMARKTELLSIIKDISSNPMDHLLHFKLAKYYFSVGRLIPAIAECRTSLAFGNDSSEALGFLTKVHKALGLTELTNACFDDPQEKHGAYSRDLPKISPLNYQRLNALATLIRKTFPHEHVRVIDVGGGEGELCLFLTKVHYVLVEPTINGISGQQSGLPKHYFDIVVACHVLEHIPESEREDFLEELCSLGKNRVIVLCPMADDGSTALADALIYRLIHTPWAAEHLSCRLPKLDMLSAFAHKRGLRHRVLPNGDRAAAFWMVFARHYASVAGKTDELEEIEYFSNRYLNDNLFSPNQPNDYIVEFYLDGSDFFQ